MNLHAIQNFKVGDKVKITQERYNIMLNGNRSIHVHPGDKFLEKAHKVMKDKVVGTVTHRFPPGYEMSVSFDYGQDQPNVILHMKDNWVEPVIDKHEDMAEFVL